MRLLLAHRDVKVRVTEVSQGGAIQLEVVTVTEVNQGEAAVSVLGVKVRVTEVSQGVAAINSL